MTTIRHFENQNLKERSTYLFWLLTVNAGLIGFQLLRSIRSSYSNSEDIIGWIFTFTIIIIWTVYFLLHKRFVSITFNISINQITLTTTTLLSGTITNHFNSSEISYNKGKEKAGFRKGATEFIEIYKKKQKLIKLEKTTIGEYAYDNILNEFDQIKNTV